MISIMFPTKGELIVYSESMSAKTKIAGTIYDDCIVWKNEQVEIVEKILNELKKHITTYDSKLFFVVTKKNEKGLDIVVTSTEKAMIGATLIAVGLDQIITTG